MNTKLYAQPKVGQELRGGGKWERATDAQQKKLVRVFDEWSVSVRKEILKARNASKNELIRIIDRRISELETNILEVMRTGVLKAAIASVGIEHVNDPVVLSAQNKQIMENENLVKGALIPNIHLALRQKILEREEVNPRELLEDFQPMRVRTAQYAGGFWVMIFNVQQAAGIELERQRKQQGLPVEPVRWVLDPAAEHCNPSPGYFGCIELKGEYPNGWSSLPTVPAGQVTCRGNCRCHLEVFKNGKWQRGVF